MSTLSNYNPSVPEVLSLIALIPSTPPPPPNILSLLQPFLSTVSTPWLRNFLFTSSPIHISPLMSPTLSDTAITTAFTTTRVETLSPLPSPYLPESHHLQGRMLYTPSLTSPTHTLGFGVMEILAKEGQFWQQDAPTCAASMPFRFIRHNPSHLLIHVFDTPCEDAAFIQFSKQTSTTSALTVTAFFTRSKLISLLDASPTPQQIESAAHFIQQELQRRACPVCAAPPGADCTCPLSSANPLHPFDTAHFASSIAIHNGVFESLTSKRVYPIHGSDRHCVLGTRSWFGTVSDHAFVRRVGDWALSGYLNLCRNDKPWKSLPIAMDGPLCQRAFTPPRFDEDDPQDGRQNFGVDDVLASLDFTDIDITSASSTAPALISPNLQPLDDSWWAEACQRQAAYAMGQGLGQPPPPVGSIDTASTQLVHTKNGTHFVSANNWSSSSGVFSVSKESDGGVSRSGVVENKAVSIEKTTPNASTEKAEMDAKLHAKQLKAQRRRERNRACAQRSNQRAKESRDRLVANLNGCKEQVEVLRARELELRKENLVLRKSVADLL